MYWLYTIAYEFTFMCGFFTLIIDSFRLVYLESNFLNVTINEKGTFKKKMYDKFKFILYVFSLLLKVVNIECKMLPKYLYYIVKT